MDNSTAAGRCPKPGRQAELPDRTLRKRRQKTGQCSLTPATLPALDSVNSHHHSLRAGYIDGAKRYVLNPFVER